jgi:UDP:flavonoid glycosyltransferase YjiC (YdhE family)
MTNWKFVLAPMGSAGDVHPMVWLAKLLAGRGHEVVMVGQEGIRDISERAGLRTVTWGNREEQQAILRNPDLWHPKKAFDLIAKHAGLWAGQIMAAVEAEVEEGRTVILAGALAYGARMAGEKRGAPVLTVHLQSSIFTSVEESPVMMAGWEWLPGSPRLVRKAIFRFGNWMVDRKLGPGIRESRAAAGLPVGGKSGVLHSWWHSEDGVVCLFPEWYARKQSDWPARTVLTRFPLYDEGVDRPVDEKLEAFLAAGDKPVVITPGSANAQGGRFIRETVAACVRMKKRPLVVTRFPETAGTLPAEGAVFAYVPFGRVFPRAAAVVHHGGIGTMAQGFAAGVPQLVMPMAHDQPDNAYRMKKRLGVGDYLYPKKFTAARVATVLERLLRDPAVAAACRGVKGHMEAQMPAAEVAEIVEGLAGELFKERSGRAAVAV